MSYENIPAYAIEELGTKADKAGDTFTGPVTVDGDDLSVVNGNLIIDGGQAYVVGPNVMTPTGDSQTIDWNNGNYQVLDLGSATDDVTVTFSNVKAGATYILEVIQGATERAIVWPTMTWPGGTEIVLSSADDAVDVVVILAKATDTFRASFNQNFS